MRNTITRRSRNLVRVLVRDRREIDAAIAIDIINATDREIVSPVAVEAEVAIATKREAAVASARLAIPPVLSETALRRPREIIAEFRTRPKWNPKE